MRSHSFSKTWSGSPVASTKKHPLLSLAKFAGSRLHLPSSLISHHTNHDPDPSCTSLNMFDVLALALIIVFPWSSHYSLLTTSLSFKDSFKCHHLAKPYDTLSV